MTNKKLGNDFEREFARYLMNNGYWVLNVPQRADGQPADLIAVKNEKAALIDCKVCSRKGFPLSRIEPNQRTSMSYWTDCGNGCGWFAIKRNDQKIYMLSLIGLDSFSENTGAGVISNEEMEQYGILAEEWVMNI